MAQSAARAGFVPICFDYFNDVDLLRCVRDTGGSATKITGYDDSTLSLLDGVSSDVPLMYGGAVENNPEFVDRIAQSRPVWGVTGEALRRCRDPWEVQRVADRCGFYKLAVQREKPGPGNWTWKPFASGGGIDINNPKCGKPGFYQQTAEGWGEDSYLGIRTRLRGTTFLGDKDMDRLGETVSRPGREHGLLRPEFRHMNGAINYDAAVIEMADEFDLLGCFGIDMIEDDISIGAVCVLEINPRWTATAELHERVSGVSLVSFHAAAFDDQYAPIRRDDCTSQSRKVVFFAPYRLRTYIPGPITPWSQYPSLADVPPVGAVIERDEPICTVFFDNTPNDPVLRDRLLEAAERSILSQCERA